jgi:hypothetical protein
VRVGAAAAGKEEWVQGGISGQATTGTRRSDRIVGEAEQMGPVAICVLSWSIDDLSGWTHTHRPLDPRSGEKLDATAPKFDSVIEVGLAIISPKSFVNHSDFKRVTQNLKAFTMTGRTFDPRRSGSGHSPTARPPKR